MEGGDMDALFHIRVQKTGDSSLTSETTYSSCLSTPLQPVTDSVADKEREKKVL